jgi:RNA polymerase sigma-70 factor (ECF subfamily)
MDEERAQRDRQLSERLGAGDFAALEEVYDAYSTAIYRQAVSILGSTADAEDVLQDVFLQLVRRSGGPIQDLKAYLLTAARHQSCSFLRRRRHDERGCAAEASLTVSEDGPERFADRHVLREALQALPSAQREVVVLKVYEQLTFEEIGKAVKASVNTVASRYRYALRKLRKALGDSLDVP